MVGIRRTTLPPFRVRGQVVFFLGSAGNGKISSALRLDYADVAVAILASDIATGGERRHRVLLGSTVCGRPAAAQLISSPGRTARIAPPGA
jgi:hypothetical protein